MKIRLTALVALLALGSQGALADSVHHRLQQARSDQASAVGTLQNLEGDLARIGAQLATAQAQVDDATVRLVNARNQEEDARIRYALARDVMVRRVRIAYEQGPAATLDMYLSAESAGDLLSINEFTSHAMISDIDAMHQVELGREQLARIRQGLSIRQAALAKQQQQVATLLEQMQLRVSQAQELAADAGVRVKSLEAQAQAIADARAREAERTALLAAGPSGADQAKLLALLGPSGGRGCDIPSGLQATGQSIAGDASWYGDDFAGQPTASGAIFDPSLFTAAHRTLPLGVFLRVHYNGNCAIVLVNDRGPYGNYERIIDLAQGAADYLGIGVAHVTADVLVPR